MAYDWNRGSQYLADLLTGLGSGMLSRQPGSSGWSGIGMGINNANQLMASRRAYEDQETTRKLQQLQLQRQVDADAEVKRQKESAKLWLLGQKAPPSMGAAQRATGPTQPGAISSLPANMQPFFTGMADVNPTGAMEMAGQYMLNPPKPEAPLVKDFSEGGNVVSKQWNPSTGQWDSLSTAPRWQPPQPPQMPADMQLWLIDRKNDPTNPNFKTIADWRKYQQASSAAIPGIVTLFDGKGGQKAFYANDPAIKGMLDQGWTDKAPSATTAPDIITLYGPSGATKSVQKNDPAIPGMLAQGWVAAAPKDAKPGLITLTKGDQTKTILDNDPQLGMYLGSDWVEAGKGTPAKAGPVITGEQAKAQNLDPSRSWQQKADGSWDEILPKTMAAPQYMTLVSPDGASVTTLDKASPNVKALLDEGYVERSGADPNTKPFAEDERKTAQLLTEILPDYKIAVDKFDALTQLGNQVAGKSPDIIQSYFTSEDYQRGINALSHIIANNLYSLSGAAITDVEAQRRARLLLPNPGDAPGTISDKKARIAGLLDGMKARAGRAGAGLNIPAGTDVPSDLPPGTVYFGQSKNGKRVFKRPDGQTVEEQ